MEDEQIIELYTARDECAITQTDQKYGAYCLQLANSILDNEQDSEEMVNDTWLRAWNTIPPQRPNVLRLYLAKITRNLSFSRYRAMTAEKRGGGQMELTLDELSQCVSTGETPEASVELKELTVSIQRLLETLTARDRHIFIRRYFFVDTTAEIAQRYDLKESNVLMILARTRKKLKTHLMKEGYWL